MKPRLHIPLNPNQTTRQRRRVVWITAKMLIMLGLLFAVGRMFLLRSSLLTMAPSGTDIAASFVGEQNLNGLFEHLGDNQAITGRSLSFNDLRPYVGREMALFIDLETQTQSIAFQGTLAEQVQVAWSNYGISVVEFEGVTTLSTQGVEFQKINTQLRLASLLPNYAGEVFLQDEGGPLFLHKDGFLTRVHTGVDAGRTEMEMNQNTLALVPIEWTEWKQLGIESAGMVRLDIDERGIAYLLQLDHSLDSQTLAKIVQKVALLQQPTADSVELPDQSDAQELRLNEGFITVSIEELEQGVRITAKSDELDTVIGWVDGDKTYLTNRAGFPVGSSDSGMISTCLKSSAIHVFPKKLHAAGLLQSPFLYSPYHLLNSFEEIALSSGKMKFCW